MLPPLLGVYLKFICSHLMLSIYLVMSGHYTNKSCNFLNVQTLTLSLVMMIQPSFSPFFFSSTPSPHPPCTPHPPQL